MKFHAKIFKIKEYIFNDDDYMSLAKNFNYSIDNYVLAVDSLITDDLKWKMELFGKRYSCVEGSFTNNQVVFVTIEFQLQQYAKFLIYMHYKVLKHNLNDEYEIKKMHLKQYELHSQRNFNTPNKKFYLA